MECHAMQKVHDSAICDVREDVRGRSINNNTRKPGRERNNKETKMKTNNRTERTGSRWDIVQKNVCTKKKGV
jgi:hypothetical protein